MINKLIIYQKLYDVILYTIPILTDHPTVRIMATQRPPGGRRSVTNPDLWRRLVGGRRR